MFDGPSLAIAVRWGLFTALVAVIGAVAFRFLVLGRLASTTAAGRALRARLLGAHERSVASLGCLAAAAFLPLALGRLGLTVAEFRDPTEPWAAPAAIMLFETTWGIGWWLQVAAAVLCLIGFLIIRGRRGGPAAPHRAGWPIVAIGTVALAMTPALSGHAIGSPRLPALAVAGDTLHVLGAGAWLGALAIALATVVGRRREAGPEVADDVAAVIRAFSPVALAGAALVLASGILASWLHVGTVALLWKTTYGRLLIVKIALFTVVVALGAFNWRRLAPRLGSAAGVEALRASARAELIVALLVLLVTAVLVATPLPDEG